jgi:hypothetical protein
VPRTRAAGPHFDTDEQIRWGSLRQDNQFVAAAPTRRPPWRSFGSIVAALIEDLFATANPGRTRRIASGGNQWRVSAG